MTEPAGSMNDGAVVPLGERIVEWTMLALASSAILSVLGIFLFLGFEALPVFATVPLENLLSDRWQPVSEDPGPGYGLFPLLAGTFSVTLLGIVIALPFGVGGAVYLAEFARPGERELLKPAVEIIAGIPSVVLGFFGLVVIGPAIQKIFGLPSGLTALTAAVLLAFMAIPTIMSVSEDALRSVPWALREASWAIGANRWQTTMRIVLPAARSGVAAAVMLGIGRVIGETMAVMMVAGNSPLTTMSPLRPVRSMTATIAAEMGEVEFGGEHYRILFLVGLVLLVITLAFNMLARRLLHRPGRGSGT